jgi:hypothetical protein
MGMTKVGHGHRKAHAAEKPESVFGRLVEIERDASGGVGIRPGRLLRRRE